MRHCTGEGEGRGGKGGEILEGETRREEGRGKGRGKGRGGEGS